MGLDIESEEKEVKTPKTRTKRTKELLAENEKRMEELKVQKEEMHKALETLDNESNALGDKSAVDLEITHEKYGNGKIVKQDGKYIEVKFSNVVKKFVLPGAIADGYLMIDDEELLDYYKKANDIHNRQLKAQLALSSAVFAMERIQDDIDKLKEKA